MNKKYLLLSLILILILILFPIPSSAQAQDTGLPPVVAANGFSCVKTQMMVSCRGNFPRVPGTFSASGAHQVNIIYETPDVPGNRFSFESSTGCMMRVSFDLAGASKEVTVWNAAGRSKSFSMPSQEPEASRFCRGK